MTGQNASPRRVGIVGLGVMGGSLARSLKALPDPPRVIGASHDPRDLEAALAMGVVDEGTLRGEEAATDRDLVIYATPLGVTLRLMEAHRAVWAPGALVTDVASLKAPVLRAMEGLGEAERYVGSHPMAGGEGSGFQGSRDGLFAGATVWLSASKATPEHRGEMEAFWTRLGSRTRWTDADEHDALMIRVSHLPQLTSNALALALEAMGVDRKDLGPGGRDMTRLAGSAPGMWVDLVEGAGPDLPRVLKEVEEALAGLRQRLEEGRTKEVGDLMERTRAWSRRDAWS